jgi:hypothetical protein
MVTAPDTRRPEWETTDSPVSAGPVVVGPFGAIGLGDAPGVDVVPEGIVPPGPPEPPEPADCTTIVPDMLDPCTSQ